MKKISLKNVKETLTRKEMKVIIGGGYSVCSTTAYIAATLQEEAYTYQTGGCFSSSQYNAAYNDAYKQCIG